MWRHLNGCLPGHESGTAPYSSLIQLRVESDGPWWLDIEASADATLAHLDGFLRAAWLDCCGHMSAFYPERSRDEYKPGAKLGAIFAGPESKVRYEYDFGSTTQLRLRATGSRSGSTGKSRVRLLARNEPPGWTCGQCEQPATMLCPFTYDEDCFVCDTHSGTHACDDSECHLPVVNSPRMGVCGYTGPMG
jgi:hypothetical protein